MADDKKRDDHSIEMGGVGKEYESRPSPRAVHVPSAAAVVNNPIFPILSYCGSSILMTVTNKFVLSGRDFNLNFFLLAVQVRILESLDDVS
jgi:GDP-mannose transporter